MRKFVFIILAFLLLGCGGRGNTSLAPNAEEPIVLELVSLSIDDDHYEVIIEIKNFSEYDHIIQEVKLSDGSTLVECFHVQPGDSIIDNHRDRIDDRDRRMIIYPGIVEGADWKSAFAHLPQNHDGSAITTVGSAFNSVYQQNYETTGEVVEEFRDALTRWSIDYDDNQIVVAIGEYRYILSRQTR